MLPITGHLSTFPHMTAPSLLLAVFPWKFLKDREYFVIGTVEEKWLRSSNSEQGPSRQWQHGKSCECENKYSEQCGDGPHIPKEIACPLESVADLGKVLGSRLRSLNEIQQKTGKFWRLWSQGRNVIKVSFKEKNLIQECSEDGKCESLEWEMPNMYCAVIHAEAGKSLH